MKMEDVVVVHPIQQHSLLLANVLFKDNRLNCFYTTMYFDEKGLLFKFLNFLLPDKYKHKLSNKKNLPFDHKVKSYYSILGVIFIALGKTPLPKKLLNIYKDWLTKIFSRRVSRDIKKNRKVNYVISFDTYSNDLYKFLRGYNVKKILDMSSIPVKKINEIIDEEISKNHMFKKDLIRTKKSFTKRMTVKSLEEIKCADSFLVASKFTEQTLKQVNNTVVEKQVEIAPYYLEKYFFNQTRQLDNKKGIRFLFVGRLTAVKGFHYLLEAITSLGIDYEFTIVGHIQSSKKYIASIPDNVKYLGVINKSKMNEIYSKSDILIFPSLFDGFGQAIIEAMASSLPVITTKNSGASEYVINGENGFVIEPGDIQLLIEKIIWFSNNKEKIPLMGKKSYEVASEFTEEMYYEHVSKLI